MPNALAAPLLHLLGDPLALAQQVLARALARDKHEARVRRSHARADVGARGVFGVVCEVHGAFHGARGNIRGRGFITAAGEGVEAMERGAVAAHDHGNEDGFVGRAGGKRGEDSVDFGVRWGQGSSGVFGRIVMVRGG